MLGVLGSPAWRTVSGGSRVYVERVAQQLADVRLGTPVRGLTEVADGVVIEADDGTRQRYDAAVVATHAPQALALLAEPTPQQRSVLGAIPYSRNVARLHTDASILPRHPRARASWNYLVPGSERADEVVVTYDLTRLQRLRTDGLRLLVTLGGDDLVDPSQVLATMTYDHPLYTAGSVAAQARLPEIATDRIAFAGAYHGWGFHEDGALSGLRAAEHLGARWDAPAQPPHRPRHPVLPLVYRTRVTHSRTSPTHYRFANRSCSWLVDLDHLPDHGVLARFEARDHIGDPERSIRDNIDAFLAEHGIDLAGGQVLMLTGPRVAGFCFNPITVYWCRRSDDELAGVVDKALYVSPFNDTSGTYRLHVPEPDERLHLVVRLEREGQSPFVATVTGTAEPATLATVRRLAWRHPVEPLAVATRIRRHGVALWRRLPVVERPVHPPQPGVLGRHGIAADRWPDVATVPSGWRARVGARVTRWLLRSLARTVAVRFVLPDGSVVGDRTDATELPVLRILRLDDLCRRVGAHGLIGFGESYMAGDWEADHLTAVLTAFAVRIEELVPRSWQFLRAAYVARHPADQRGTVDNTQANVAHHYDLSNDLFAAFLDPSMTYSSALFATQAPTEDDLHGAQLAKIDRLLDEAGVGPGTRLLEIGTGWGELALRAARRGAQVTTVTLSVEQRDLAVRRVAEAGLADRVEVLVRDYRLVEGQYDAVVSVEMVEAVGLDYLPEYVETIDRVLAPGGRVAIQAITMPDHRMRATRYTRTWVHKYIFPGGFIPSLEALERAIAPTSLRVSGDLAMGRDYATTLRLWDERFARAWPGLGHLGLDETFRRMWHFYLCYSRAGFEADYLDVHQLTLTRPGEPSLPSSVPETTEVTA